MDTRILVLALEALNSRKAQIEKEIGEIRKQLGGGELPGPFAAPAKNLSRSEKMKAYWAARKKSGQTFR
jgi:hypothetical protein